MSASHLRSSPASSDRPRRPEAASPAPRDISLPLEPAFADLSVSEYVGIWFVRSSRRALDRLFAAGRVRGGGRPVGADRRVGDAGEITVVGGIADLPRLAAPAGETGIRIIDEDERLTVLEKPSGVPVIPDGRRPGASCLELLVERECRSRPGRPVSEYVRPRIVHRIDRPTSGLLLVARSPEAERFLGEAFERRQVRKTYLALTDGEPPAARTRVDVPLRTGRRRKTVPGPVGKGAVTEFDVLERFGSSAFVAVRPRTGRTHQIRAHARLAGWPLRGDPLYGRRGSRPEPPGGRLALHAWRYVLPPRWPGPRQLECPLAADLADTLERLRQR